MRLKISVYKYNKKGEPGELVKKMFVRLEEIDIAIGKINKLHTHGFGSGLTLREQDIINSDAVSVVGKSGWGKIFERSKIIDKEV
jgi:hypothetical protein